MHAWTVARDFWALFDKVRCSVSDSDPDPVGSAFKLGRIRDPDPYSESGSGSWIQMSKNRLKKPKFTVTDFKDENRKMLRLS
jgi:hypothetical protein